MFPLQPYGSCHAYVFSRHPALKPRLRDIVRLSHGGWGNVDQTLDVYAKDQDRNVKCREKWTHEKNNLTSNFTWTGKYQP